MAKKYVVECKKCGNTQFLKERRWMEFMDIKQCQECKSTDLNKKDIK